MAKRHEFISADHCEMCRQIAEYREESDGWSHRDGCGCDKCVVVEKLSDARSRGKEDARVDRAYREGRQVG